MARGWERSTSSRDSRAPSSSTRWRARRRPSRRAASRSSTTCTDSTSPSRGPRPWPSSSGARCSPTRRSTRRGAARRQRALPLRRRGQDRLIVSSPTGRCQGRRGSVARSASTTSRSSASVTLAQTRRASASKRSEASKSPPTAAARAEASRAAARVPVGHVPRAGDRDVARRVVGGRVRLPQDSVHPRAQPVATADVGGADVFDLSPVVEGGVRPRDHRVVVLDRPVIPVEQLPGGVVEVHAEAPVVDVAHDGNLARWSGEGGRAASASRGRAGPATALRRRGQRRPEAALAADAGQGVPDGPLGELGGDPEVDGIPQGHGRGALDAVAAVHEHSLALGPELAQRRGRVVEDEVEVRVGLLLLPRR